MGKHGDHLKKDFSSFSTLVDWKNRLNFCKTPFRQKSGFPKYWQNGLITFSRKWTQSESFRIYIKIINVWIPVILVYLIYGNGLGYSLNLFIVKIYCNIFFTSTKYFIIASAFNRYHLNFISLHNAILNLFHLKYLDLMIILVRI